MNVRRLERADRPRWDAFVRAHPDGSFFHLAAWSDQVREVAPHVASYLLAENGAGDVDGVLPLFLVDSPLTGRAAVSVPYGVYGGILARSSAAERALLEEARLVTDAFGARHLELRNVRAVDADLARSALYVTFVRELPATEEECLGLIPRKSRATTRNARDRFGLKFVAGERLLDRFHELFVANKRDLGSPAFSRRYFARLLERFGDAALLHGVEHEGRVIAAVISFLHAGTINPYYSGALPGTERMGSMNFMYWQLMEEGVRRGMRRYDFGRSRAGTGAFAFKQNMGFEPTPLEYQYYLRDGDDLPSLNPSNPKFDAVKGAMQRLPFGMVRRLGPWLMRHLP